jgi:exonuclease SbcD
MYYDFLMNVRLSGCKHIIVVGGNHDSPSFLNAPKIILSALNIRVVGNAGDNIEDELIIIKDDNETPLLIVCAVPFLRERDISRFIAGESYGERSKRVNESIKKHYEDIALLAQNKRNEFGKNIPIIATGHLSVAGGKRNDDDGVRETYVGNIGAVGSDIFPETFDYVALGHYHIPSAIKEHIRYCGSPIPMGFGEVGQTKCVYVIDFSSGREISTVDIPVFQKMESIEGDKGFIEERLMALKESGESVCVEIVYTGDLIFPKLSERAKELAANSNIEILKIQSRKHLNDVLTQTDTVKKLNEMGYMDVFNTLIEKKTIPEDQKKELINTYKEIVDIMHVKIHQE